jgi:hypothetical protein
MGNFVLVYKGGEPSTEDEGEAVMAAWGAWIGALGDSLVDLGNPFGASSTVAADGSISDGASSELTGYSILAADSLSAAAAAAKGCPVLGRGGSVEVYETYKVM